MIRLIEKDLLAYGYVTKVTEQERQSDMNAIYTILIQETGRWCEYFASDLLVDIKRIEEYIQLWDFPEYVLLGLRKCGVDSGDQIRARGVECYRKIFKLTFDVKANEVTTKLYEMD